MVLTSSSSTIQENREILESSKLEFISFPTIVFKPIKKERINFKDYEWLIVSSRKVYDFLAPLVFPQELQKIKIAAVGEATSRYLKEKNLKVHFVASTFTGEDFAREFAKKFSGMKGKVLRPVSNSAPRTMEKILKNFSLDVDTFPLYATVCPSYTEEEKKKIKDLSFQAILFTSPSTWHNFKRIFGHDHISLLAGKTIAVIGPATGKTLEKDGCRKYIMPEKHTLAELIKKLEGEIR